MSALGKQARDASALSETVEWIRQVQHADGMIPWFSGGHADPWNHVEAAMALTVGGAVSAARRAYEWLRSTQRPDGSWHTYYLNGAEVEDARLDTNVSAYVATGVWHQFLATEDLGFLEHMWPCVERAVGFVLSWQRPGGELAWSVEPDGTPGSYALLAGSSSAYFTSRDRAQHRGLC
jgi:squalene cyclase